MSPNLSNIKRRNIIVLIIIFIVTGLACRSISAGFRSTRTVDETLETEEVSVLPPTATSTSKLSEPVLVNTTTPSNPICVISKNHPTLLNVDFPDIQNALLDFLNQGASYTEVVGAISDEGVANLPISVAEGDMTGDGKNDFIISIFNPTSPNNPPGGKLLIYVCREDHFILGYNQATPELMGGPKIWFLKDLDADSLEELVASSIQCGAHTCFEEVEIVSWDGNKFVDSLEGSSSDLAFPLVDIYDDDNDDIYSLEVTGTGIASVGAGPQRNVSRIWKYQSNRKKWVISDEIMGESEYRIHIVHDADKAAKAGEYQQALVLYERVINDTNLVDWQNPNDERIALAAYSRYKMIAIYDILGQIEFAHTILTELADSARENSSQVPYFEMADIFQEAFIEKGVSSGCRDVEKYAESHSEGILIPLNSFGYGNPGYTAEDICPFV